MTRQDCMRRGGGREGYGGQERDRGGALTPGDGGWVRAQVLNEIRNESNEKGRLAVKQAYTIGRETDILDVLP